MITKSYCSYCRSYHQLMYLVERGGSKHLIRKCPDGATKFLPFIEGLEIPTTYSKRWHKAEQQQRQQTLF